jgi:chemotaxis protein MotB
LAELDQRLKEREANLEQMSGSKTKLESTLAEREKRVNELEKMLNDQKERANALKNNLTNALKSFSASDLTVEEREGKVYVSLSQKLLFATGSKSIDNQGKLAISKLAEVLKKNKETLITVEGHTDSDGDDLANWNLSVGRATTIVGEMIKSGVEPDQLIASGRGEHHPVSDNGSPEGKAKNRRSEIIITPDLSKLYQLINTN